MFEVTREIFHREMADAVFTHLRDFLLEKESNHCQRVEFLPVEVMRLICELISKDTALQKRGIEAFVLAESAGGTLEIESGALIEKRNRHSFGVLVAFIPQGLRLPAEDSYISRTFKNLRPFQRTPLHTPRNGRCAPADGCEDRDGGY